MTATLPHASQSDVVWIETSAKKSLTMRAKRADVRALIMDVPTSGPFFPGVDRIEDRGDGEYRWLLTERRTLGSSFRGDYITRYSDNGDDEVRWNSLEGNLKVEGRWRLSGPDGQVLVTVEVKTELDAPVPRILKKPAILFAEKEARDGLGAQLERIRRHLGA